MGVGATIRFSLCVLAAWTVGFSTAALAQPSDLAPSLLTDTEALSTNHPAIRASLDRLFAGSAAWREALADLVRTGRRAIIVTPDKVRVTDAEGRPEKPFDPTVLAEVQPIPDAHHRVNTVIVIVNVELLETLHARNWRMFDLDADLDRILAHEVYGHAIPYLLSGHLSARCADPAPGQRPADACAIQRENQVRSQLGLGRRVDSGLNGLALARRHYN